MKSIVIIATSIVVLFFLINTIEPVFGEISYPSLNQRLKDLPTYCIVEPNGLTASDRGKYVRLAVDGVSEWDTKLQGYETVNPSIWKIKSKIISSSDDKSGCSIVMNFKKTVKQISADGKTTIGIFRSSTQSIDIATENLSLKKIYNVIIHEIGHSIGLGHYVSDDNEENKKWYTGKVFSPSIMIPTTNNVPSMMTVMGTDLNKVREIYGSEGFYAFSPKSVPSFPGTPTPSPIIPIKPIIPINPFKSIEISNEQIIVKPYETKYVKISGQIDDSIFHQGQPVYVLVKKPDYSFDAHKLRATSSGYFELPLAFDDSSKKGWYEVEASYLEHIDRSMNFDFSVNSELSLSPEIKKYETPEPEMSENSSKFGKYFDDIVIEANNDEYTVTPKFSKNSIENQIRITAENECPFKNQVFQKDFRYSKGADTSFSFTQRSDNRPVNCSIVFTVENFEGKLLDSINVDYDAQTQTQIDYEKIRQQQIESLQKIKQEKEKQANEQREKEIKNEVTMLKNKSEKEILELEKGISIAEKALKKLNPNSYDKKAIDKAWDLLKINQQKLENIQNIVEKGDKQFDYELYSNAKTFYDLESEDNIEIGHNLQEISKIIDKAQPKNCFLFWCW